MQNMISDMNLILNARVIGEGEQTVVLSHGYGGSQAIWDNLVPYLSQGYQILLFDWNFSGSSVKDAGTEQEMGDIDYSSKYSFTSLSEDLVSLMDRLSIRGAIFIGHSMACMVGCIASIIRPNLFAHLVLIAGSPRYLNSEDYVGGFERREVEQMLSRMEVDFQTWVEGFIEVAMGSVDNQVDQISMEKLGKSFRCMKPEVAVSLARTIFLGDMREMLDNVRVDCTIVQISNDFVVPLSVGHYMFTKFMTRSAKTSASASLEIIDSNGHFPQFTAPLKLLEILDRTLMNIHINAKLKI